MIRFAVLVIFLLSGCTSTRTYENVNQSLGLIRKAVVDVMGEPRYVSRNQRELYSPYFSPKPDTKFDPAKSKQRAFARFTVLGDRRPYDIEITVFVEERDEDGGYSLSHSDGDLAEKLLVEYKQKLSQSIENRNVIDDFRVF